MNDFALKKETVLFHIKAQKIVVGKESVQVALDGSHGLPAHSMLYGVEGVVSQSDEQRCDHIPDLRNIGIGGMDFQNRRGIPRGQVLHERLDTAGTASRLYRFPQYRRERSRCQAEKCVDILPLNETVMNVLRDRYKSDVRLDGYIFSNTVSARKGNRLLMKAFYVALEKLEFAISGFMTFDAHLLHD
jgi:hypothetical protein